MPIDFSIATQPSGGNAVVGDTVSMSVVVAGGVSLLYQWFKGTSQVGTNSATFSKTDAQTTDADTYYCAISDASGVLITTPVVWTVGSQQSRYLPQTSNSNSYGSGFLSKADITDSIAQDFINSNDPRVQSWLDDVDGELLSLAQELECPMQSLTVPLHKKVLEYCRSYFCFVCFEDTWGRNDIAQTNLETIKLKLDYYSKRCEKLRVQITKEMLLYTNLSLQASQRGRGTISILRA
jgi:hypothetical protein